jgi:aspartyl-tRNA(Asn)/glutamyl-tRNA(Gln) amidotransferase subunit A
VIATPTSPFPAFRLGEKLEDPLQMYLCDVLTTPANLAGVPGISVPCGQTAAGLPVGLQLLGPVLGEERVLQVAAAYQGATDHHLQEPAL